MVDKKNSWMRARLTGWTTLTDSKFLLHEPILWGYKMLPDVIELRQGSCIWQKGHYLWFVDLKDSQEQPWGT